MSFSADAGYLPISIPELMNIVRENVNTQFGTSYAESDFLGTNFYKYFYALIQRLQENEIKTAEIFQRLQEYFRTTNETIIRPNTTAPGIYDFFLSKGYTISIKPPAELDAGKIFICVDVDDEAEDYADKKLEICGYVRDCTVAGVISQGTEVESLTLSNGQSFDFKYLLPERVETKLKLTLTLSVNNMYAIGTPDEVKAALLANIAARYRLGTNFEPQRYFSILDAPWASSVLLEYSFDDGASWESAVFEADFDEFLEITLPNIEIVEA